jgi:hypothetical protein
MNSPVAIGGVGGSGTRVLAAMLQELDWSIGPELNHALDNGWFEHFFWNPSLRMHAERDDLIRRAKAFADASSAIDRPSAETRKTVRASIGSAMGARIRRHGRSRVQRAKDTGEVITRARNIAKGAHFDAAKQPGWGWKQPTTHLYLEELAEAIPNLRYVHLVRHGLDMAFSNNQAQLRSFSPWYGLPAVGQERGEELAVLSLAFWAKANQRAVDVGERLLGDRFLLLRFEDVCRDPASAVEKFCNLIGADPDAATRARLEAMPSEPSTAGRSAGAQLDRFDDGDLDALRRFGYEPIGS